MNKWTWLCPWFSIALGAAVLVLWGLTLWTALLIALFADCTINGLPGNHAMGGGQIASSS